MCCVALCLTSPSSATLVQSMVALNSISLIHYPWNQWVESRKRSNQWWCTFREGMPNAQDGIREIEKNPLMNKKTTEYEKRLIQKRLNPKGSSSVYDSSLPVAAITLCASSVSASVPAFVFLFLPSCLPSHLHCTSVQKHQLLLIPALAGGRVRRSTTWRAI